MFERRAFQSWYVWRAGVLRCLQCLLALALIASARSARALDDPEAPMCDPEAIASGSQLSGSQLSGSQLSGSQLSGSQSECERPAPAPIVLPDAPEAPMCDETGASVAARIVIPEVDRGRLEALPCELVLALFGGKRLDFPRASARWGSHRPPAEPTELTLARADATLAAPLLMPERTEPCSLLDPLRPGLGACPGHLRPPYRPPLG